MANVLYKTEDDTHVITIPDPPNPIQPNPDSDSAPPNYPPPTPPSPPPPSNENNEGSFIKIVDEQGNIVGVIMCGNNGCQATYF